MGERDGVQQQHAPQRQLPRELVGGLERRLQAGERRRRAARPGLARRLGLEARAAGERPGELARVEVGQEAAVQVAVLADRGRVLLGHGPADVVVAADVGDPARAGRRRRHVRERARHQRHAARRERAPQQHHQHVVVGQIALLALVPAGAEVGDEVAGGDDRLCLERHARGRDPHQRAERLQQLVRLGLVLGVGALALPQERDGVEPQHVDAGVGQPEHRLGHRPEHGRVRVVEVPLVRVERRPHPALQRRFPGEAPGRGLREHVGQRALVGVGHGPVGERAVVRELAGVAAHRRARPAVLARGVVEHHVDAERHPLRPQRRGERGEIRQRPELGLHRAVVDDRVAAVVGLGPRVQQRHQVQVADPELAQVGQPRADAGERAAEAVGVGHVAQRLLALQPIGRDLALVVEQAQLRAARGGRAGDRVQQRVPLGREARVAAVERGERVAQLGEEALEPHVERGVAPDPAEGALVIGAHVGTHRVDVLHPRY